MGSERGYCESELAYIKGLGTADEIAKKIADAESKGDYSAAYDLAYDAVQYGKGDFAAKKEELKSILDRIQKDLLDTNPLGQTVIRTDGLFQSACCSELKEAILRGEVGVTVDCMTNIPMIALSDDELFFKATGQHKYDEYDFYEADCCPYCGKEIYDYLVEYRRRDVGDSGKP